MVAGHYPKLKIEYFEDLFIKIKKVPRYSFEGFYHGRDGLLRSSERDIDRGIS